MAEVEEGELDANAIGEQLKAAREAKEMSLADVAAKTRIPIRHLQHMENGEWDALPAPTYSVGFARAFANAVGLDGTALAAELREQIGSGPAPAAYSFYEPSDPARVPPRPLAILAGLFAVLLVVGYLVWRNNAVDDTPDAAPPAATPTAAVAPPAAAPAVSMPTLGSDQPLGGPSAAAGTGPVVITATQDVWLRVYEGGGGPRLFENTLKAGERYEVPSNALHPQILTGRPNAIAVTVGQTTIPQLGAADRTISDVSLLPADLLARVNPPAAGAAPGSRPPQAPAPIPAAPAAH
jgi:cytoskeleton protein RodZ